MSWSIRAVGTKLAIQQTIDKASQGPYALPSKVAESIKNAVDAFPTPSKMDSADTAVSVLSLDSTGHIDPQGGYSNCKIDLAFVRFVVEEPPAKPT